MIIITQDLEPLKQLLDEFDFDNDLKECENEGNPYKYISFSFPVARGFEEIIVYDDDEVDIITKSRFVYYRGIKNYEAIWSKELKCIECEVGEFESVLPSRYTLRKLSNLYEACEQLTDERGNRIPKSILLYDNQVVRVTVGYSSREFAFLSRYKEGRHISINEITERFPITLKIENINCTTESNARELLEKISNAVLYQIDYTANIPITLAPRRLSRKERGNRIRKERKTNNSLPSINLNYEYDKVPMALYWLAKTNTNSPIFMYFALYQVLEYYFPIYSSVEIKTRARNLIKDPKFNINSDADMMRLLSIMSSNNVNSLGDEREQLDNVLHHVISGEEIIDFIKEKGHLEQYYSNNEYKKLSGQKLRLGDKTGIINDLAIRIYDIRCSIVHNKASEITKKILPMTKEETLLRNEIEVLELMVQKVIIANSKPMSLN